MHTKFTLDESGGMIGLFKSQRTSVIAVDWVVYETQYTGSSFDRCRDGGLEWGYFWWEDASPGCANYVCGDVNADCGSNLLDGIYLANYKFKNGDPPTDPICRANPNGDGVVDLSDVLYIANYFLKAGPAPNNCGNYVP